MSIQHQLNRYGHNVTQTNAHLLTVTTSGVKTRCHGENGKTMSVKAGPLPNYHDGLYISLLYGSVRLLCYSINELNIITCVSCL